MLKVIKDETRLLIEYKPERGEVNWVDEVLEKKGKVFIYRAFYFQPKHLLNEPNSRAEYFDNSRTFVLGAVQGDYYVIDKSILDIQFDLLISKKMSITKKTFITTDYISIFSKIDLLVKEQIVIGGDRENAVPIDDFERLLGVFPTKTTLHHFANSRISEILKDYLGTISDAQKKFDDHLKRQGSITAKSKVEFFNQYEVEKYTYIRNSLKEMLDNWEAYKEENWQKIMVDFLLLLYPKYVAVLEKVHIKDYYSNPVKPTNRYIDLTLVDANGNIDIIEIKKPFQSCLVSVNKYNRDNHIPKAELSGTIVQVEKYLFHLNKWGIIGEKEINEKRFHELPKGMKIKITNPKAMVILGRDNDFNNDQKFDFEIIKRKYANIMDIITYDDLLNRLDNIISRFKVEA